MLKKLNPSRAYQPFVDKLRTQLDCSMKFVVIGVYTFLNRGILTEFIFDMTTVSYSV